MIRHLQVYKSGKMSEREEPVAMLTSGGSGKIIFTKFINFLTLPIAL